MDKYFNELNTAIFSLLTEIKSAPKKTPVTPLIERIFLISSLLTFFLSVISYDPSIETVFPGKNLREFGFGVV